MSRKLNRSLAVESLERRDLLAGDGFADAVLTYEHGPSVASHVSDPSKAIGAPDWGPYDESGIVSLGSAGVIELLFLDEVGIDGPGDDLQVYEAGSGDTGVYYLSDDEGETWHEIGIFDGSFRFDLAGSGLSVFNAIRIVDDPPSGRSRTPGVDLDAVQVLNVAYSIQPGDLYADVVIGYSEGPGVFDATEAPPHGNDDPSAALGAPNNEKVSLGESGSIVLGFTDNLAVDGPGLDLRVVEGGTPETAEVFGSSDGGANFVSLGFAVGTTDFDLSGTGLASVNAVKIVDSPPSGQSGTAGFDLDAVVALNVAIEFEGGDANQDLRFDQSDIGQVFLANKYGTGRPATWREGDWNGDGLFDQEDIVAALQTGNYLQGPYAAEAANALAKAVDPDRAELLDGLFADSGA